MQSLRSITLFAGLAADVVARAEAACRWHERSSGELVIDQKDTSTDVYFLTKGRARVVVYSSSGKAVAFREIKAGDMFGELAAIDGKPRSAAIEALETCQFASMSAIDFQRLATDEPSVLKSLLGHLVGLVRGLSDRVYEFGTLAVANRIHAELLRLARGSAIDGARARITPAPKHADIAALVGTHREAVAREFSRLRRMGLVERKGSALIIMDLEQLRLMVVGHND